MLRIEKVEGSIKGKDGIISMRFVAKVDGIPTLMHVRTVGDKAGIARAVEHAHKVESWSTEFPGATIRKDLVGT